MSDDWRLQIDLRSESRVKALVEFLDARQLQHNLNCAFEERVVVTQDGPRVFLYSGTREQAEKARDLIQAQARRHGWLLDMDLCRWHPIAEDWEDPDNPLPSADSAKHREREKLMAKEREEASRRGYPDFEVRADLRSYRDAVRLSGQLRKLGVPVVHRWRYVLVGAADEDSAHALSAQIAAEIPSDGKVSVEGTLAAANASAPNPFALLPGVGR